MGLGAREMTRDKRSLALPHLQSDGIFSDAVSAVIRERTGLL